MISWLLCFLDDDAGPVSVDAKMLLTVNPMATPRIRNSPMSILDSEPLRVPPIRIAHYYYYYYYYYYCNSTTTTTATTTILGGAKDDDDDDDGDHLLSFYHYRW